MADTDSPGHGPTCRPSDGAQPDTQHPKAARGTGPLPRLGPTGVLAQAHKPGWENPGSGCGRGLCLPDASSAAPGCTRPPRACSRHRAPRAVSAELGLIALLPRKPLGTQACLGGPSLGFPGRSLAVTLVHNDGPSSQHPGHPIHTATVLAGADSGPCTNAKLNHRASFSPPCTHPPGTALTAPSLQRADSPAAPPRPPCFGSSDLV